MRLSQHAESYFFELFFAEVLLELFEELDELFFGAELDSFDLPAALVLFFCTCVFLEDEVARFADALTRAFAPLASATTRVARAEERLPPPMSRRLITRPVASYVTSSNLRPKRERFSITFLRTIVASAIC